MKNLEKNVYQAPEVSVVVLKSQSIICASAMLQDYNTVNEGRY